MNAIEFMGLFAAAFLCRSGLSAPACWPPSEIGRTESRAKGKKCISMIYVIFIMCSSDSFRPACVRHETASSQPERYRDVRSSPFAALSVNARHLLCFINAVINSNTRLKPLHRLLD